MISVPIEKFWDWKIELPDVSGATANVDQMKNTCQVLRASDRNIIRSFKFKASNEMKKYTNCLLLPFLIIISAWGVSAQGTDWRNMMETWRKAYNVPGMSVGIIYNGEVVLSEGFGVLEEGKPDKADKNTLYSIASNTKAFIAASIATLVMEGRLNWDDRVQTYLPYFELYDPCVSEMMTIRDLLCHRSGLGTFSGDVIWYRSNYTAEEVVKHVAALPREFEFRSGFGYSNVMYLAAGEVIRAVTGKSWSVYVREKFLDPLHMDRTITSTKAIPATNNVATPHKPDGNRSEPIDWVNWDNMGAAGGIISSVEDMLKWINLQLHNGILDQDTFFTKSLQAQMWTPHVNFPVSDRARTLFGGRNYNGYGLGWGTSEYHGREMLSHTGGYDGMYSAVTLLPGEKIGIVVLTNTMDGIGTWLSYEIIDRLLGLPQQGWEQMGLAQDQAHWDDRATRIRERTTAHINGTKPSMTPQEISGVYRCPVYGDIRIAEVEGQLTIDFLASPDLRARLSHWHYDTYRLDWTKEQAWFEFGTVQIMKDNNGKPSGLLFDVPNDDIFFEEIKAVRVQP
jgi:CubicO group peptidase (beta-lactamase class C family)